MNNTEQDTFYFIDYETFGTRPAVDKPCQFAGVRTDKDFNVIGSPLVIYCKPPNDYLPQPQACLITHITPQLAMAKGLDEPEFMAKIHEELSKPGTCTLGYNNIRFDDEITRYSLYRNFFDPYAWSWKNGNSRWDLLDAMRAAYALRPEGIKWPTNQDDMTSFRLEDLCAANGIEHTHAHDAMADVMATIELAKKLKNAQPRLFEYLYTHRNKNALHPLIDVVSMTPLLHVSGMFGIARSNTSWIAPVAWDPMNKNAVISIDLTQDPSPLFELDVEALRARLYTKQIDLAPDELPVPLKVIHMNKCPVLAQANTLRKEDAFRLNINTDQCLINLQRIKEHPLIREKITALYALKTPFDKPRYVDAALYDGFFSHSDTAQMEILRQTKAENLSSLDLKTADPRIKPLLFQYRARHFPWSLTENEQIKWDQHRREYFENNLPVYMNQLEDLILEHEQDTKKMEILHALYQYVQSLAS